VFEVRPARSTDADAIGRVQVETWRAAYAGLLPEHVLAGFDADERRRLWREGLAKEPAPGSATFVADLDDTVVGFASVGACRDGEGGEVYALYLLPSCWNRGIGRALLVRAEDALRGHGFERALLWVLDGNERGKRFYRAAGWVDDGSKVDLFQGVEVTELRYRKAL